MTIVAKIKKTIEEATGLPFLYHAAGDLELLLAQVPSLPVAYTFLLDTSAVADVNGIFHERATLAVVFASETAFDFNSLENEQLIDEMKRTAYKWITSIRRRYYDVLDVVAVNSAQRLYDTTAAVLTGYAVNITLQEVEGSGCEYE